ncbi:MAG: response regulator [Maribacter sp.]|uniref:response regulator n=1 Tax=Maribacter sp. 2307UL18-2 TaxID=3386274 RepID=UPI0039BD56F7
MNHYSQIYLIDDFEMSNLFHKVLFNKLKIGDEINVFTNPEKALDDLRQKVVVCDRIFILLDLNMPEMSGFEFLDIMIKEQFSEQIDVVIATSSISEDDMKKAEQYPMFVKGFVTKPLKIDRLKSLLHPLQQVNDLE